MDVEAAGVSRWGDTICIGEQPCKSAAFLGGKNPTENPAWEWEAVPVEAGRCPPSVPVSWCHSSCAVWVTGHAESWEPSHRYSNHPSHTHTPGQAEYSRTPLHDLIFGEDVGSAVQSSAGVSGVRSLSSDLSAAAVAA